MQLSTRGRYAIMALIDLVELLKNNDNQPVRLAEIAERQDISLSYLEQLFANMRRQGVVKSVRGPGGGYVLAAAPKEIHLGSVIRAVDEPVRMTRCRNGSRSCMNGKQCNAHDLWEALGHHIEFFMDNVNLQDVVADRVEDARKEMSAKFCSIEGFKVPVGAAR